MLHSPIDTAKLRISTVSQSYEVTSRRRGALRQDNDRWT